MKEEAPDPLVLLNRMRENEAKIVNYLEVLKEALSVEATLVRNINDYWGREEPGCVYVGRPSPWGNPFAVKSGNPFVMRVASREEAVSSYADWLAGRRFTHLFQPEREWILKHAPSLKGRILLCWCAPKLCHAEVLAKLAEGEAI